MPSRQPNTTSLSTLLGATLDNAVEGSVREAWSVLACAVSARRARTSALRIAYERLAMDEAGHAHLPGACFASM